MKREKLKTILLLTSANLIFSYLIDREYGTGFITPFCSVLTAAVTFMTIDYLWRPSNKFKDYTFNKKRLFPVFNHRAFSTEFRLSERLWISKINDGSHQVNTILGRSYSILPRIRFRDGKLRFYKPSEWNSLSVGYASYHKKNEFVIHIIGCYKGQYFSKRLTSVKAGEKFYFLYVGSKIIHASERHHPAKHPRYINDIELADICRRSLFGFYLFNTHKPKLPKFDDWAIMMRINNDLINNS